MRWLMLFLEMHVIRFKVRAVRTFVHKFLQNSARKKAFALLVLAFKVAHQLTAQHYTGGSFEPLHNVRGQMILRSTGL